MTKTKLIFLLLIALTPSLLMGQDIVDLNNGDHIVGELKKLENGVLEIEPDYSEENFLIDWESITTLKASGVFTIHLASGDKYNGQIGLANKTVTITLEDGSVQSYSLLDVVYLKSVNSGFWDRMSASVDGGYTFTKANNNKQFSLRGNASYMTTKINPDVYFNLVDNSIDDDTGSAVVTERNNWGANFRMFFAGSWFGLVGADYLTNDEQELELRSTYKMGAGYYPIRNYKMYMSTSVGVALNSERFTDAMTPLTNSTEGFVSLDYNAFGLDDVSITSNVQYFPSLSEKGRHRVNFTFDLKFDLPLDFYLGGSYTINYDNLPQTEGATTADYIIQTVIGWSL